MHEGAGGLGVESLGVTWVLGLLISIPLLGKRQRPFPRTCIILTGPWVCGDMDQQPGLTRMDLTTTLCRG